MTISPMLATASDVPPVGPGWVFEFKWDGIRCVADVGAAVSLRSRGGLDITAGFPELAVLSGLNRSVVLDGEIVALGPDGRPDFGLLQQRFNINENRPRFAGGVPVQYMVFDVLAIDGESVLSQPYARRRELLTGLGVESERIRVSPGFGDVPGEAVLGVAREHGLEGVVAKRAGSRYEPGARSLSWVKTVLWTFAEVVVCGWRDGDTPSTVGSLVLGAYDGDGRLRYVGNVSKGLGRDCGVLFEAVKAARVSSLSPFTLPGSKARGVRWLYPGVVGEVRYSTVSRHGVLQKPTWRGLRPEKRVSEVRSPVAGGC